MKRIVLSFLLAATGQARAWAAADEPAAFAIVEKIAGQVGFYSAAGLRLAGVKVGEHPHEIVFSPDQRFAYVSNNGILWMQYAGAGGNTISIIDLARREKAADISLGSYRRPHGMDVDPRTGRLLVTTENPSGLLLVDPAERKVLRRYDVKGDAPHMVALDAAGKWAYVSVTNSSQLSAINLETGAVKPIAVDARPQGATRSRDNRTLYLTNSGGNSISIIDLETQQRTGTIPTGEGPGRVVIAPDNKTLIYNLQTGKAVGFADIASRKETTRIPLGGNPLSLTMSVDGKFVFAGIQDQDRIVVVSVATRRIAREFKTPPKSGPDPVLPLPPQR